MKRHEAVVAITAAIISSRKYNTGYVPEETMNLRECSEAQNIVTLIEQECSFEGWDK